NQFSILNPHLLIFFTASPSAPYLVHLLKPEFDSQLDLAGIESGREAERICRTGVLSAFHPIVSQGCCSCRSVHAGVVHAIEKIEGFEDRCYAPAIFAANREVLGRPMIETQ